MFRRSKLLLMSTATIAPFFIHTIAFAQIEEIIVTAQKRKQSVQDVPIAISAFDSKFLQENGVSDISQLDGYAPNLDIRRFGSTSNIFIRGAGNTDFATFSTGAVSVYQDDVVLNSTAGNLTQVFDVDRVEVLRGPQGTLFGKNTTGGAIRVFSRLPGTEQEGFVRAGAGNNGYLTLEVGLTVPLVADKLSMRLSFVHENNDGWQTNAHIGKKFLALDRNAARAILLWTPSDTTEVILNIHGGIDNSDSDGVGKHFSTFNDGSGVLTDFLGYSDPQVNDFSVVNFNLPSTRKLKTGGGSVHINITPEGNWSFSSISAYEKLDDDNILDTDASPLNLDQNRFRTRQEQFTQELQASYSTDRINAVLGWFLFWEDFKSGTTFDAYRDCALPEFNARCKAFGLPIGLPIRIDASRETTSVAGFTQVDYALTPELTATAGLRYTWERKKIGHTSFLDFGIPAVNSRDTLNVPFNGSAAGDAFIFTLLPPTTDKASWSRLSWRAALNYKPNDDILIYGAVTRGFRAGDYNLGEFLDPAARAFYDPETALNFETGVKADFMEGRLRTNIATFYTKYKGLQVSAIRKVPGSPLPVLSVINASGADAYGFEAEITALPTDHLTLLASLGYLHTKFGSYKDCRVGIDCTGNPLPFSPKWTLGASAIYETPVAQNLIGSLRADYSYTAERYSTALADPATLAPGYINLNTRAAIKSENGKWEVGVYARNLTNEKYIESFVDIASTFGFNRALVKGERRYGIELITHW